MTPSIGSHKDLEAVVLSSVKQEFSPIARLRKTHPDQYEGGGIPDLEGHILGMHVGIELKFGEDRLSPKQLSTLIFLQQSQGLAMLWRYVPADDTIWVCSRFQLGIMPSYARTNFEKVFECALPVVSFTVKGVLTRRIQFEPLAELLMRHSMALGRAQKRVLTALLER